MRNGLKIYTSVVSKENIDMAKEQGLLPIFILRNIKNSEVIRKWSGSAIHLFVLSPSNELYQNWRDGKIDQTEYEKNYILEMSKVNFQDILEKLGYLCDLCGAQGVVLMAYGDYKYSHRRVLSELLNNSGLLSDNVKEI